MMDTRHGKGASSLVQTLAEREQYRDDYWRERDPIAPDRLLWRAQAFRHTVHLLPGQSILELGCGAGWFTRALLRVSRGENPITAVTFSADESRFAVEERGSVEVLRLHDLPGALTDRQFDCIVGSDLLDRRNGSALLEIVYQLLAPGGEMVFYESNPWNPVHKLRWMLSRVMGRRDPRYLVNQPRLYELLSTIGFVRVYAVYNDFVFAPLTRGLIWWLRNLSILLENAPVVRTMAGSILLHAQKPPLVRELPAVSLFAHESLRGAISFVIPCHNEEMNVRPLIEGLLRFYGEYVHEIIAVDDNSTDHTQLVLEELAASDSRIRPLSRGPPNGVGHAIAEGLRAATGRYVLSMDCDFQHLLPEFRELFDAAEQGFAVVVGSRFSRHSVLLNYPFGKILANRAFHALARMLFAQPFRDMTNNLKLFRREVVEQLRLREPGFAVNAETGLQPMLLGYRVAEVPISWINRTPGMGVSSFRLFEVGGGYWRVLWAIWLKRAFGVGPYRELRPRESPRTLSLRGSLGSGAAGHSRGLVAVLLLGVFVGALWLRLPLLDAQGLWGDEIFSLAMATGHSLEHPAAIAEPVLGDYVDPPGPVMVEELRGYLQHEGAPAGPGRIIRAVRLSDTSPPLYYLLLSGWTWIAGTGDAALRWFSLLLALMCLPWLAAVARSLAGSWGAVSACLLFAIAPFGVFYSTEGRMYSLLWLCVLITVYASLCLRQARVRSWWYACWLAGSIAGLLTHYFFIFPWAACVTFLLLTPGRLKRWSVGVLVLLTIMLVAPWYVQVPEILDQWRVTGDWLRLRPGDDFNRWSAGRDFVIGFFSGQNPSFWPDHRKANLLALLVWGTIALVATWRLRWRLVLGRRSLLWLWLAAVFSGPLLLDALQGTYLVAYQRYAAAALPAVCVLAAMGLQQVSRRPRAVLLVLLVVAWARVLQGIYAAPSRSSAPFREVAQAVSAEARASDLILVHSIPSGVLGMARYLETLAPVATWTGQYGNRRVPESVQELIVGCERVFLVKIHDVGEPAPAEDWLRRHARVVQETEMEAATIIEFEVEGASPNEPLPRMLSVHAR